MRTTVPVVGSAVVMIAISTTVAISTTIAISATVIVVARRAGFELLVLFLDIGDQIFAKLLGLGNHVWVRSAAIIRSVRNTNMERIMVRCIRDMKEHVLIALVVSGCFEVARAAAFDLDTTSGFLLDVLHIGTAMADHLSSQVETVNRLEIDGNLLFRPFPLQKTLAVNGVTRVKGCLILVHIRLAQLAAEALDLGVGIDARRPVEGVLA